MNEGRLIERIEAQGYTWMPHKAFYQRAWTLTPRPTIIGLTLDVPTLDTLESAILEILESLLDIFERNHLDFSTFTVYTLLDDQGEGGVVAPTTMYNIKFCA